MACAYHRTWLDDRLSDHAAVESDLALDTGAPSAPTGRPSESVGGGSHSTPLLACFVIAHVEDQ